MPIHAYRLVYPDSPHAPEMLWEWEEPYIQMLIENARTFHREVVQRYFPTWDDLAQENQRIWETHYLPRPLYQLSETWRAWLDEYREIVRDVQDMIGEHSGCHGGKTGWTLGQH
jgi:hypothetical protein